MNAKELAEKIVNTLCNKGLDGGELPWVESLLSSALEDARRNPLTMACEYRSAVRMAEEARAEGFKDAVDGYNETVFIKNVKQEAYEHAAKIAQSYRDTDHNDFASGYTAASEAIAKEIRQAAKEIK